MCDMPSSYSTIDRMFQRGDVLETEIESLGRLRNKVIWSKRRTTPLESVNWTSWSSQDWTYVPSGINIRDDVETIQESCPGFDSGYIYKNRFPNNFSARLRMFMPEVEHRPCSLRA